MTTTTQHIYIIELRNFHTKEMYFKLGYSKDVYTRITQLQRNNVHFEITDIQLYQHPVRTRGYLFAEQYIHNKHSKQSAKMPKETMPDGSTECYHYHNLYLLKDTLTGLGYECIFDTKDTQ